MPRKTTKVLVYTLGQGFATGLDGTPLRMLPCAVYYTPGYAGGEFYLSEGDGRNGGGSFLDAADVLQPPWRKLVSDAGAQWLAPLLERMAHGEEVSESEILNAYRQIHGKRPATEEWDLQ